MADDRSVTAVVHRDGHAVGTGTRSSGDSYCVVVAGDLSVRYANAGDEAVAFRVAGAGRRVVWPSNWTHNADLLESNTANAGLFRGVWAFAEAAVLDQVGTGQSDSVSSERLVDRRTWVGAISAVMNSLNWKSSALVSYDHGAFASLAFAAAHPERTEALVMIDPVVCYGGTAVYARLLAGDRVEDSVDFMASLWGTPEYLPFISPSAQGHEELCIEWARWQRQVMSPKLSRAIFDMVFRADCSDLVEKVRCPALIVQTQSVLGGQAAPLAEAIADARLVSLPIPDHVPISAADSRSILEPIAEFLTGHLPPPPTKRVLATMCFTDIVGSTAAATSMGDDAWSRALADHDRLARDIVLSNGGRVVKRTGDGMLATFPTPTEAIRGVEELQRALVRQGLTIRAGIHTGEAELDEDGDIHGVGVHVAARVASLAGPNQIFASSAVVALTAGSAIGYTELGIHELKGIGPWSVVEVMGSGPA